MNVLVLIPHKYGKAPGQRSSVELWQRVLEPAGIHLHWAPFETDRLNRIIYEPGYLLKASEMLKSFARRFVVLRDISDYDAVLVYREAALFGPAWFEKWVARRGVPIIYQLDDPLYVPYRSQTNGYLAYLKFFGKVGEICRMSKVVIANSSHHVEYVRQYNSNVFQVPSIVDTDQYVYRPQAQNDGPVTIGWSGSKSTTGNLQVVAEPLRELGGRVPHRVHLIGGTDFDLPGVQYTAQKWRAATEVEDLRKIQVGMVPLPLTEWTKRKFYLKVAQYMALGIPPVATPLGSNPEVIEHGVTGFLADTPAQWVEYLERLIRDHALRGEMSRKAAEYAEANFSLNACAPRIIEAFRAAVE